MTQHLLPDILEKTQQHVVSRALRSDSVPSIEGVFRAIHQLQRVMGNRSVEKLIQAHQLTPEGKIIGLQRKMAVGAADDRHPQGADRVPPQAMSTPDASSITPIVQPAQPISANSVSDRSKPATDAETQISLRRGRGSSVADSMRASMAPWFGADFGDVQAPSGSGDLKMNQAVGTQAFTHASDIYLNEGHSPTNLELVAHELTHFIQHPGSPPLQTKHQAEELAPLCTESAIQRICAACDASDRVKQRGDPTSGAGNGGKPVTGVQRRHEHISRAMSAMEAVMVQRDSPKKRPPKPPPKPKFTLSGLTFVVDGTTIKPTGKDGSWKFTPSVASATPVSSSPAPTATPATPTTPTSPTEFDAERTMAGSDYLSAGGASSPLGERAKVKIAANKATVDALIAVLPVTGAPQLTMTLDKDEGATTKPVAVGAQSASALEVSITGLTPKDGDTISISNKKGKELFVFSTLKPAAGTEVKGFFAIGRQNIYKGTVGVAGESRTVAPFASTFNKLVTAGKLGAAVAGEKAVYAATSEIEGGFDTTQTYDTGVLTFGFGQWTANASLPQMLKRVPDEVFNLHLGKYGLGRGTPAFGTVTQMRKIVPPQELAKASKEDVLALRNASEGSITLDGKELISANAYALAQAWASKHEEFLKELAILKADLAGADKAKAAQAEKTIGTRWAQLAGLPGIPKEPPGGASADQRADTLIAGATAAKAAADAAVAGAQSVEAIRTNEWVLRFQMAGQDPAMQVAQVEHAHATLDSLKKRTDGTGVPYGILLPTDRGRAVLFSTYLNSPKSLFKGMKASVPEFKMNKVAEAEKTVKAAADKVAETTKAKAAPDKIAEATKAKEAADKAKAAWEKFPWPVGDTNWTIYYTDAAAKEFEQLAEPKVLEGTTDPKNRAKVMNKRFAP